MALVKEGCRPISTTHFLRRQPNGITKKVFTQPANGFTSNFVDVNGVLRLSGVNINNENNQLAEPRVAILIMGYKNLKRHADGGLTLPYKTMGN